MDKKKLAGEAAVELVEDGMIVGLGTGSTAYWAIQAIGRKVAAGLRIQGVPTSVQSETLALQLGIPLLPWAELGRIDLTIDGADELDPQLQLIKGGGGALLREKIVASLSQQLIIVADESKAVDRLGAFPLPVEIVPFAWQATRRQVRALGCEAALRGGETEPFVTDNGNYILDCKFGVIEHAHDLQVQLSAIPGVVETGLFLGMASAAYIGCSDGTVKRLDKPAI
ncbi:ribose-5-phosphate isomerase RpiA [Paenibacillus chartarius]|uniref:Ribose-5-phosphate isomerase A n=1 Tax=Paenibacillus chartarius TaxID=747481 RepID=A0ABV6DUL7_9BACL